MPRLVRIIGWILFAVSLLAALYGIFGGPSADTVPWFAVCIITWIISQFVLAFARRLARAAARANEDQESTLLS